MQVASASCSPGRLAGVRRLGAELVAAIGVLADCVNASGVCGAWSPTPCELSSGTLIAGGCSAGVCSNGGN